MTEQEYAASYAAYIAECKEPEFLAGYTEHVNRCEKNGVYPPYSFRTWKRLRVCP